MTFVDTHTRYTHTRLDVVAHTLTELKRILTFCLLNWDENHIFLKICACSSNNNKTPTVPTYVVGFNRINNRRHYTNETKNTCKWKITHSIHRKSVSAPNPHITLTLEYGIALWKCLMVKRCKIKTKTVWNLQRMKEQLQQYTTAVEIENEKFVSACYFADLCSMSHLIRHVLNQHHM